MSITFPPELLPEAENPEAAVVIADGKVVARKGYVQCPACSGFDNFCHKCGGWGLVPGAVP